MAGQMCGNADTRDCIGKILLPATETTSTASAGRRNGKTSAAARAALALPFQARMMRLAWIQSPVAVCVETILFPSDVYQSALYLFMVPIILSLCTAPII